MHKRRNTVFFPAILRSKANNDSKSNLNQTTDFDMSVLSKKNIDNLDVKHCINDEYEKSSKSIKSSNFKPQSNEPK